MPNINLTKEIEIDGEKVVSCAFLGTSKCSGSCIECEIMCAMINKLHMIEVAIKENSRKE